MKVAHQDAFCDMIKDAPSIEGAGRLLAAAGVRYVISLRRTDDVRFRLIQTISAETVKVANRTDKFQLYLYEYRDYPGRLFLAGTGRFLTSDQAIAKTLADKDVDLQRELILYGRTAGIVEHGPAKGQAHIVSYGPNRIVAEYDADRDCFLYLSDTYYPGWRAYVDGRETPIYRANLAFRAIEVPEGRHRVVFTYVPYSFYTGLLLTLTGIGLSLILLKREKPYTSSL